MGIQERRQKERELMTTNILQATKKRFLESGYSGTQLDDIASDCEIGKGTIYLYFHSKEEIAIVLMTDILESMYHDMQEAMIDVTKGNDQFRRIGLSYLSFFKNNHDDFELLSRIQQIEFSNNPKNQSAYEQLQKINQEMYTLLVGCISGGIKDGSINSNLDPALTALILPAMTQSLLTLVSQSTDVLMNHFGVSPEQLLTYYFEFLEGAVNANEQ